MSRAGRVCHPQDLKPAEVSAWESLCLEHASLRFAFLSPHYARAVGAVRNDARVLVLSEAGSPVAFFPFQFASKSAQLLAFAEPIGGDMTDYVGLIAAPGFRIEPLELLRHAGLQGFSFTHLDETQAAYGLAGDEEESGLRIELEAGFEPYWQALREENKSFVQKTERRERHAVRDHGELRLAVDPENRTALLDDLIARKRAQYAATGAKDALAPEWKRGLLKQLLATSEKTCAGELTVLHAGESWVATHFGLRCGERLNYWFPVYERSLNKLSPGRLLLKATMERAHELELGMIDRGAGDSQAKRDFANASHLFSSGSWQRSSLRSTTFRAVRSLRWRWEGLKEGAEKG